jgi:hypothetical protein
MATSWKSESSGSFGIPELKSRARSLIERNPFAASGMPASPACTIPLKL